MYFFLLPLLLMSDDVCARTIKGMADQLLNESSQIGLVVCSMGFIWGAASLAFGKPGAGMQLTGSAIGMLIVLGQAAITVFFRGVV